MSVTGVPTEADPGPEQREIPDELSELEVALLGLLSVRPMTGYEIRTHYARGLSPWWETPRTQIYPKLRELEQRGLIHHEYVVQQGKPNKRLYSLDPAGAEALTSWLQQEIRRPEMKHHMMMRLFLGNHLPLDITRALLEGYRDRMTAWAGSLRQAHEKFSASLEGPYRTSVFFELLSLEHLIAVADLEVNGTTRVLEALESAPDLLTRPNGGQLRQLIDVFREHWS